SVSVRIGPPVTGFHWPTVQPSSGAANSTALSELFWPRLGAATCTQLVVQVGVDVPVTVGVTVSAGGGGAAGRPGATMARPAAGAPPGWLANAMMAPNTSGTARRTTARCHCLRVRISMTELLS